MLFVTGVAQSNIGQTHRELPEDSLHHPLAAKYKRRQLLSQEGPMETQVYADGTGKAALETKSTTIL